MAIRPRSDGFQVDITVNGHRYRKGGFTTHLEAEQHERDARTKLERGEKLEVDGVSTPTTLKHLYDQTYTHVWRGSKAERTSVLNAEACLAALGETTLITQVTTSLIDSMVSKFQLAGNSGGTVNRKLAALSKMLTFAVQRGWLKSRPHLQRRREAEHRIRWFTQEEETRMLGWFTLTSRTEMHDLVTLLIDTGLRVSEALRLSAKDVVDGWVRVWESKGGTPRSVPMTARVKAMFLRRGGRPFNGGTVTHDQRGTNSTGLMDYWSANYQWDAMREALWPKDKQVVMHALRHTFCSRLAQAGVPIQTIQQLAGHKTISVTLRYAHLCPTTLQSAINVLQAQVTPCDAVPPQVKATA
jgi:site-specific recombinase XerD